MGHRLRRPRSDGTRNSADRATPNTDLQNRLRVCISHTWSTFGIEPLHVRLENRGMGGFFRTTSSSHRNVSSIVMTRGGLARFHSDQRPCFRIERVTCKVWVDRSPRNTSSPDSEKMRKRWCRNPIRTRRRPRRRRRTSRKACRQARSSFTCWAHVGGYDKGGNIGVVKKAAGKIACQNEPVA